MLYKMVLTFESMDKILTCDHSNVANAILFCGAVFFKTMSEIYASGHEEANPVF